MKKLFISQPMKGKSLQLLSTADVIFFAEGWRENRGCRIEHLCAEEYGVTIIE